ncbi:MAG: hypothetical protein COB03_19225 [Alteromonas sp.]|jgi:hypothetical protein|nr:MAG: hypothetical protein COB03_19225 [Alteromonas sp.]|tara:strand:+ start:1298 stop:1873 length:576 start_codon:yes stop_codon:yes gene_type:complete
MKRPNILTTSTNNELAGSGDNSSWIQGRNCVYHESSTLQYRVSILTVTGWETYGYFNDLEVASYVANIAILCNGCEDKYQLNSVGDKDSAELNSWRSRDENLILERKARSIFSKLQVQLAQIREQEVALREKLKREADISRVEREEMMKKKDAEETALISKAPKTILLDLLQSDIGGDLYRKIRAEIDKRY